MHRLPEDSPEKQAYKEVTEKPTKKTIGDQKLTSHQVINRDLNTIDIDLQTSIKLLKRRIQPRGMEGCLSENGDAEVELSQDRNYPRSEMRRDDEKFKINT